MTEQYEERIEELDAVMNEDPVPSDYDLSEDYFPEDHPIFVDCTCDHEPVEHGWMECEVDDCPCKGRWEE